MNQQEIMLAAIGDLEVTRRALIMEINARDARIEELEQKLAAYEPPEGRPENGQMVLEEVEVE